MHTLIQQITKNVPEADLTAAGDEVLNLLAKYEGQQPIITHRITPAIAAVFLREFNPENRPLSINTVNQLVSDMENDRFLADNGETVVISKEGLLNDGQHRFAAIAKSGKTQHMSLALGRERDSRFTLDTGRKRTSGHVLGLMGYAYGVTLAAAAKRIEAYRNNGATTNVNQVSDSRALEIATTDELLREICQWAHINQTYFRAMKMPSSEVATCFYLFAEKAPREARQFMEALKEGLGLAKGQPILAIRQKLLMCQRSTMSERFEIMVRGWNSWIRDETVDRVVIRGNVPDIKGVKRAYKTTTVGVDKINAARKAPVNA